MMAWRPLGPMIWKYLPFGSGLGSFTEIYQVDEPVQSLSPTFFAHAHNEPLEIALTAGLPGAAIVIGAILAYMIATRRLMWCATGDGQAVTRGRLGAIILLLLGLASLVDYPLRTPALMALASLAAIWMADGCAAATATRTTAGGD